HRDTKDSIAATTVLFAWTDAPVEEGFEGGRIYFNELGAYGVLNSFIIENFSGRESHGGTPPRGAKGVIIDKPYVRVAIVLYPPSLVTSGNAVYNI
ncbi:hypothetical protein CYLTODRAFT_328785, partial [Cylindrobasidium torrendii FP15055 ss-10]